MHYLLAIGIILFALVCYVKLQWGVFLCILLLPVYLIRFKVFFVPTNALDMMIFILFIVWVRKFSIFNFQFLIKDQLSKKNYDNCLDIKKLFKIQNSKFKIIFILLSSSLLSALLNNNKLKSLSLVKSWILSPIILFVIISATLDSKKDCEAILSAIAISGVIISIASLICRFLGTITYDGRLQGIYNSPNYLAMYLAPCLLVCIYKIVKNSKTQIPNNKQIQNSNFSIFKTVSNFEHLILRFIWYLEFDHWNFLRFWCFVFLLILFVIYYTYSYATWLALFIALVILGQFSINDTISNNKKNENLNIKNLFKIQNLKFKINYYLKFGIWCLGVILILFVIYYTYSYATWLALFIALVILGQFSISNFQMFKSRDFKINYYLKFGIWCLGVGIIIFIVKTQLNSPKLLNLLKFDRSSLQSRLMIWRSAAILLKENPLWGIGLANFQDKYLSLAGNFSEPYLEWAVPHPHNIFLVWWLGCGLLGLLGFIGILFLFFKKGLDLLKSNPLLGALLLAIMIYILVHGLVDTTYFKNDLAIVFWIIAAICVNYNKDFIN